MLNISDDDIKFEEQAKNFKAFSFVSSGKIISIFNKISIVFAFLSVSLLFLPWTQNISGNGRVTTFLPEQRVQTVQSPIPGRIVQWNVREGDTVSVGDTIAFIAEVKDEYFDPYMLERLTSERDSKKSAIESYYSKADALQRQMVALNNARDIKTLQARQKVIADSNKFAASTIKLELAGIQYRRTDTLFSKGIASKFDLEKRTQAIRDAEADFTNSKAMYDNSITELEGIDADYAEKYAKTESDYYATLSQAYTGEAEIAKLENKISSFMIRQSYYHITARQNGLISRTFKSGLGENIKEGEPIAEIIPLFTELAVEIYIRPVDLPLVFTDQKVRIQFDGWPAIVFSGWPNTSFGTFGALVAAVENVTDKNGMYRILLVPDKNDDKWPALVRYGSGAKAIMLLQDVPVWYELWRQLNGFPPEFYGGAKQK